MRGIAVTLVMLSHSVIDFVPGGAHGVDVFFVLSGYLITSVLLRDLDNAGTILFRNFYIRRALRLFPALALLLLVYIPLVFLISKHHRESLFAALAAATYTMNWVRAFELGSEDVLGHTWSLSIEEQFYLIWPLLLLILNRYLSRNAATVAAIALASASLSWRCFLDVHGSSAARTYNGFDTRADSLLIGCALALWISSGALKEPAARKLSRLWPVPVAILIVIIFTRWEPITMAQCGYTIIAAATAWVILSIAYPRHIWLNRILRLSILVWLGRISYGIYLWHYPIFSFLAGRGIQEWSLFACGLAVTVAVATGSYFLAERPFLRLKVRYQ